MIPLEDNFADIIGKAQRGLGLSDTQLVEKARVNSQTVRKLRAGEFDELTVLRIAPVLGLAARALCETGAEVFAPEREPVPGAEKFDEGKRFRVGKIDIEARLTWGHSPGGMTFVVTGLARPVAIVGDSLFAGSMGGGTVSYKDALRNN